MWSAWGIRYTYSTVSGNFGGNTVGKIPDGVINVIRGEQNVSRYFECLVQALDRWRNGEEVTRPKNPMFDGMRNIFVLQNIIGWRPFIGVCISHMWVRVQDQYL